ncbi:hypothetical protein [Nocardiopsis nanhaiensis]
MAALSRRQVILAFEEIRNIINGSQGIDDELLDEKIEQLYFGIPCPNVSDIIFYPHYHGLNPDGGTIEEMADAAMSYKPFEMGPG